MDEGLAEFSRTIVLPISAHLYKLKIASIDERYLLGTRAVVRDQGLCRRRPELGAVAAGRLVERCSPVVLHCAR